MKRLHREALALLSDPPEGISGGPSDENIFVWKVTITGPIDSPFAGGMFKLVVTMPNDYPFKGPKNARFLSKMFHPNINPEGYVDMDVLCTCRHEWSPAFTVARPLKRIRNLLINPTDDHVCNPIAENLYKTNKKEYNDRVRSIIEETLGPGETESAPPQPAFTEGLQRSSPKVQGSSLGALPTQVFGTRFPDFGHTLEMFKTLFTGISGTRDHAMLTPEQAELESSGIPALDSSNSASQEEGSSHDLEKLSGSYNNSRVVSSPSGNQAEEAHNSTSQDESESGLNLKDLMAIHTPLDLTRQVVIPDYRHQAHRGLAIVYTGLWGDAKVAIKVLKFRKTGKADAYWDVSNTRRVQREINVWAALKHRNVIEFLGYSTDFAHFPAMISPWCEGGTVSEHLEKQELTVNKRVILAHDVSQGLQYLHQLKVIHGDIKPTNILLGDEGVAKLCDFGLVRLADWEGPAGMTTTSPYTGTERYKAPELFISPENRRPIATFEGDIYSLGSVLLEFIERIYPFQRYTKACDLRDAIMDGHSPALRSETTHALGGMTEFLWNLMEACWGDPSDRPGINAVVDAMDNFARTTPSSS